MDQTGEGERLKLLSVLVPPFLDEGMREAVRRGLYISKSELIRQAVSKELRRLNIISIGGGGGVNGGSDR